MCEAAKKKTHQDVGPHKRSHPNTTFSLQEGGFPSVGPFKQKFIW